MRALVTDGAERPALAITRSLGRRGVSVLVGDELPASLASSSKYCLRHVTYPSPYRDPEVFHQFLLDFVERAGIDVLIPVSDVTTYLIAQNRARFQRCAIAAPPFEAFDFVSDKWSLLQYAASRGIPIPRTHFVDDSTAVDALAAQLEYPAVVKPARSRIPTRLGWTATEVRYAHSASELVRLYREVEYLASYRSMVQERIVGPGIGVFVLCDRGRVRAAFAHRRVREKPPSGGVSVLSESVALDPQLEDQAARLLGSLGWHGVAMLEYKQDGRTGRPVLMEVNGRFWGSLQLAVDAGVDFPYLAYQLALGRAPDPRGPYQVGIRSRWLLGDLDHLYLRLTRSARDLPLTAPPMPRAVIEFLKGFSPDVKSDTFRCDDPAPMLRELSQYSNALCISAIRRAGSGIAGAGGRSSSTPLVHLRNRERV